MWVLGAQKNRLIQMVLLSTHNICFGLEIKPNWFLITHFYLKVLMRSVSGICLQWAYEFYNEQLNSVVSN